VLRDSFQSEIPTLNVLAILALFIKVFFGLLAGVGYCCVVIGLTLQSTFAILKISLAKSYQLISPLFE